MAVPETIVALCRRFADAEERAWVVGGCLRDILLGHGVSDWDLATTAEPPRIQRLFRRVIPTGIEHGTVTVRFRGESYEITTLRGEGTYTDGRRPDSVFFVSDIQEDLARRDFTVNAIAYDPLDRTLIDPFGGLEDLDRKVLRAVGRPLDRFMEDGLRILRGARFTATLPEFTLDPETEAAFRPALPTFARVSHERIRDEWMKTMRGSRPSNAFEVMARTGILEVVSEELARLASPSAAPEPWRTTLSAVDACRGGAMVRHAALFHRVAGEPYVVADAFFRDFRYSTDERRRVTHLLRCLPVSYDPSWSDPDMRRFLQTVHPENLSDLLELARAIEEAAGDPHPAWLDALATRASTVMEGLVLSPKDLAITGNDLMAELGIGPGPHVGALLRVLVERVTEDPAANQREQLLALGATLVALPPDGSRSDEA